MARQPIITIHQLFCRPTLNYFALCKRNWQIKQHFLIRTHLHNLFRSNVIRCFDVLGVIVSHKKTLRSVKAVKRVIIKHFYVLDFTKGCQRKNCAQDEFDSASSNDVSSLINSISKTRQSSLFCTVWGPIISRDSWFLDRLTLLVFFLVLKCFDKQLTTVSVKISCRLFCRPTQASTPSREKHSGDVGDCGVYKQQNLK